MNTREFKTTISENNCDKVYDKRLDKVMDKVKKELACIDNVRKICDGCGLCCE